MVFLQLIHIVSSIEYTVGQSDVEDGVSSVKVGSSRNKRKSVVLIFRTSYTEPIISPTRALIIKVLDNNQTEVGESLIRLLIFYNG